MKDIIIAFLVVLFLAVACYGCIDTFNSCDRENGKIVKNLYGFYECVEKGEH